MKEHLSKTDRVSLIAIFSFAYQHSAVHDFYRPGQEVYFRFDMTEMAKKGHDIKDYICPDSIERFDDYVKLGDKFYRVLFIKDLAAYIKDSMVSELTELNRNLMLSIDILPIPTDEAVREVENRLLGVETNITNWQRKQNQNNNYSAVVPYDMELQRNGNSFILGVSGSGKSFTGKCEISNLMLDGDSDIIIIDPEREYAPLVKALGGEIIDISATRKKKKNAMDMNKEYGDGEDPVILKDRSHR